LSGLGTRIETAAPGVEKEKACKARTLQAFLVSDEAGRD
jgi:hypothetical protein